MYTILKNFLKVTHIILLILMFGVIILSIVNPELLKEGIDWLGRMIQSFGNWNYLLLFLVAMIESFPFLGVVIPGLNVMILVGGFFVMRDGEVFFWAALIAMCGASIGNALGYFLGKYMGQEIIEKYGIWFGLDQTTLPIVQKQMQKNGFWFIIGGKFHNLLRSFIPYLAGSQGLSGKKFWIANLIGSFLWAVIILLIGVFFVASYEAILRYMSYGIVVIVIIIMIVVYFRQKNNNSLAKKKE